MLFEPGPHFESLSRLKLDHKIITDVWLTIVSTKSQNRMRFLWNWYPLFNLSFYNIQSLQIKWKCLYTHNTIQHYKHEYKCKQTFVLMHNLNQINRLSIWIIPPLSIFWKHISRKDTSYTSSYLNGLKRLITSDDSRYCTQKRGKNVSNFKTISIIFNKFLKSGPEHIFSRSMIILKVI